MKAYTCLRQTHWYLFLLTFFLTACGSSGSPDDVLSGKGDCSLGGQVCNTEPQNQTPEISLLLEVDNGESITQLKENASASLRVTIKRPDNSVIKDIPVYFTAERGALNSESDLSDQNGVAEVTLTGVEGDLGVATATASVTIDGNELTASIIYQVIEQNTSVSPSLLLGYFDDQNEFIAGKIKTERINIHAGSSLGLSVYLVDQNFNPILSPTSVTFTSECINNEKATIDSPVITTSGFAQATYKDVNCAGSQGATEIISATVASETSTILASTQIELLSEQLGSIEFVSAEPESIGLRGAGGIGQQENSTVTFRVRGELGNPMAQQNVNFKLSTNSGGLRLSSETGITDAEGLVSTQVISGSVPTTATVTVSVQHGDTLIQSNSNVLSINTGLPDQSSFTLAVETLNPEAFNIAGELIRVTAYLTDTHRNPVPDGTAVSFTAESGRIDGSCTTTDGNCSVNWSSQAPWIRNHRVTILATAEGHEYFQDQNGDGLYSLEEDGGAFSIPEATLNLNPIFSGFSSMGYIFEAFDRYQSANPTARFGFLDMPAPWVDANENRQFDSGERLVVQHQNNGSEADGVFTGTPLCKNQHFENECSTSSFSRLRKAVVIVTSSSEAHFELRNRDSKKVIASSLTDTPDDSLEISQGDSVRLVLDVCDTAYQVMPFNTQIDITSDVGTTSGEVSYTVPNTYHANVTPTSEDCGSNGHRMAFSLVNNLGVDAISQVGTLLITITTPSGRVTQSQVEVDFNV